MMSKEPFADQKGKCKSQIDVRRKDVSCMDAVKCSNFIEHVLE